MHGIASGIAPDNEPLREEKVRFARFASPYRGRESGGSILLLSQPSSRPVVFEERQLNYLATTHMGTEVQPARGRPRLSHTTCAFSICPAVPQHAHSELAPVEPGAIRALLASAGGREVHPFWNDSQGCF